MLAWKAGKSCFKINVNLIVKKGSLIFNHFSVVLKHNVFLYGQDGGVVQWLALLANFLKKTSEIRFHTGLRLACGLSKVFNVKILWKWSQMELRFSPFYLSAKATRHHHHHHHHHHHYHHHFKVFNTGNSERFKYTYIHLSVCENPSSFCV